MARYVFRCEKCNKVEEIIRPMSNSPGFELACPCGSTMYRDLRSVRGFVFKPYVEDRIDGSDIHITTPEQRDKLLAEHKLTYDSVNYTQLKKPEAAAEQLNIEEVLSEARKNPRVAEREKSDGVTETGVGEIPTRELN